MSDGEVKEEKIEEAEPEQDAIVPGFLLNALTNIQFEPVPFPHTSAWQIVPVDAILEDGSAKEVYFVAETRIRGSEIGVWWYDAEKLRDYIEMAQRALQRLGAAQHMANPLVVATAAQMKTEAAAAGLIIPGR